MTSGTTWAGIVGTLIMLGLLCYKHNSAFLIGISLVTFVSWFRNTPFTYFPDTVDGNDRFDYFKKVVSVEKLDMLMLNFTSELSDAGAALFSKCTQRFAFLSPRDADIFMSWIRDYSNSPTFKSFLICGLP